MKPISYESVHNPYILQSTSKRKNIFERDVEQFRSGSAISQGSLEVCDAMVARLDALVDNMKNDLIARPIAFGKVTRASIVREVMRLGVELLERSVTPRNLIPYSVSMLQLERYAG
ncbi:MAG: hypothetical protein HQL91_04750 [Magnetococcales bacterium]|nr:hypothetical protein [Magnetococcales bacterium]